MGLSLVSAAVRLHICPYYLCYKKCLIGLCRVQLLLFLHLIQMVCVCVCVRVCVRVCVVSLEIPNELLLSFHQTFPFFFTGYRPEVFVQAVAVIDQGGSVNSLNRKKTRKSRQVGGKSECIMQLLLHSCIP